MSIDSLLEFRKAYPHKSPYCSALAFIDLQEKQIRQAVDGQYKIREGYNKRMHELIDLIDRMLNDPDNNIKPIYKNKFQDCK